MKPCYRFKYVSINTQLVKMLEEFEEIQDAWGKYDENNALLGELGMEIVDLQVCCETLLYQLGFNKTDRKALKFSVFEKNYKRGYYDKV